MRAKKVPLWASKDLYVDGPRTGDATKIAPPTSTFEQGFIPDEPVPAQHDAYWRHHVGRQVELSARTALRSWRPLGAAYANAPRSACYSTFAGVTYFPSATSATLAYVPDGLAVLASVPTLTLTAGAGAFVPRDVVFNRNTGYTFALGTNSTIPANSVWSSTDVISGFAEETMTGLDDGAYVGAVDSVSGDVIVFFDDANRVVYRNETGVTFSSAGSRGGAAPALAALGAKAAVHNNVAILAYVLAGVITIEVATLPAAPGAWTTYTPTFVSGTPGNVLDIKWSDSYQCWMILSQSELVAFTNPAGPHTTFDCTPGLTAVSGALFDVGAVCLTASSGWRELFIRDDLDNTGFSAVTRQNMGDGHSGTGFVKADGSALWAFAGDGNWQRTLRVS